MHGQFPKGTARVFCRSSAGYDVSSHWSVIQATVFFKEHANILALTLCNIGTAKSAAYKIAVDEPLTELNAVIGGLTVQDYTCKGLMQHLVKHGGHVIILYQTVCRLDLVIVDTTAAPTLYIVGQKYSCKLCSSLTHTDS